MSRDCPRSLMRRASLFTLVALLWMSTITFAQSPWERAAGNLSVFKT
jgi:hypothetical protein